MKKIIFLILLAIGGLVFMLLKAQPIKQTPEYRIINAHEHLQSEKGVAKFREAMRRVGVVQTVIVGSPEATILKGRAGFEGEEKYNQVVLEVARKYPKEFIAFPTINPKDPEKLERLKGYIAQGARGLKLYNGHTFFYEIPLDDPGMMSIYAYCEKNQIPILYHVNSGHYQEAFEGILKKHPKLKVICPHFCLATIKHSRFRYLMDTYPNLYTDISFGFLEFLNAALLRISRGRDTYRQLFIDYQDRIVFGTDMVITNAKYKTADWLEDASRVYRDLLEKDRFTFFAIPGMTLRGLYLDENVLRKIYRTNFERFMTPDA